MKKKLFIIALFPLFFSCESDREKLRGHWHLYSINEYHFFNKNEYSTIDFDENGFAFFNKYGFYRSDFNAPINEKENTIKMGGECLILNFKYEWKKDSLFFIQTNQEGIFYAEKCGIGCCDKQKDFFSYSNLNIDLPIVIDSLGLIPADSLIRSLEAPILLGLTKQTYNGHGPYCSLKLDNKYASHCDLKLWHELFKKTVPLNFRKKTYITIYSNNTVNVNLLFEIMNELKSLKVDFIYSALREKDTSKKLKTWRRRIDLNDPDLKTIILKHYDEFEPSLLYEKCR